MSSGAQISIIIPAYNVERYLSQTLDSIIVQSITEWECIVVDDGSTDGTWRIIERYAAADGRIRGFSRPNRGAAEARNYGLSQMGPGTKYVIFMDSDDVYLPDALMTLHAAAEARPDLIGAHGIAEYIDSEGRPLHPGFFADFGRSRLGVQADRSSWAGGADGPVGTAGEGAAPSGYVHRSAGHRGEGRTNGQVHVSAGRLGLLDPYCPARGLRISGQDRSVVPAA
jgi:glycosyltransferase involved in cell wall biosynthesis